MVLSLNPGGLENVVLSLAGHTDKERFNVSVCCLDEFGDLEEKFRELDINLIFFKRKRRGTDWLLPIKLSRLLRREHIDIVHTHNYSPNFYGAIASRLYCDLKTITTQHNKRFFEELNKKRQAAFRALYYLTDRIVFVSEDAKNLAIKKTKISSKKVSVIHNGIDTNKFRPGAKKRTLLNELGIGNEFVIGSISRLSKEKDLATILKAYKLVLEKRENIKLLIVGDGPEKASLVRDCFDLKVNSSIIFTGYRDDIPDLLNILDLFVMTSITEGISITLLEAMAAKKPVIATEVGGNTEIIEDRHSGFLVKPKDVVSIANKSISLINDPKERARISLNARRQVIEKFSLERMVEKYESLYFSNSKSIR